MGTERTPRHSSRLREKSKREFRMPSRDDVLDEIEAIPYRNLGHLKPRKIINDFTKEHNSYNNRNDLPEFSEDEESLSDFIVETPTTSKRKRRKNVLETSHRKRRQRVRALDSDSEEEEVRKSRRLRKQAKKEYHKPDKEEAWKKILESCEETTSEEEGIVSLGGTTSDDGERMRGSDDDTTEDEGRIDNLNQIEKNKKKPLADDSESSSGIEEKADSDRKRSHAKIETGQTCPHRETEEVEVNDEPEFECKVKNEDTELDPSSDEEASAIGINRRLRFKVHHRSQQGKALDSEDSDSDNEVNASFAKREQKRKEIVLNSDG
ncbi:putative sarcoplasmic reticulum histidine-rich calcium-binding protein isoform X1 [Apostichopus japonicus]|uniref:Putative sarcoplasmic reticulum histidine-rich calcium-binding protein isoform X1 n=1 Tax=Stichopus japonicus TaxID=307972 RepID=A0A2G8JII5_STIJA|nr:putative sarcoplasmic reticulum histidine-rich calcium-binding protein isoform X1 [Apostichopus japonicus]